MSEQQHIKVGAIWRRKKTGALLRITHAEDTTSKWNPSTYYDIAWETVEKPKRRGKSYEEYWLKKCEPVVSDLDPCVECVEPCRDEDLQCRHGLPICGDCWPNGCRLCIDDLEDDAQDAIFDGVRDAARDREERDA